MPKILYSHVNLAICEKEKQILINPLSERFYNFTCEEMGSVFFDATLSLDEDGSYVIEGKQILYNEHSDTGSDYEKLLCKHPKELIKEGALFWLFGLYKVSGVHKREVHSKYRCRYKEYCIIQREQILSLEFADSEKELKNDA